MKTPDSELVIGSFGRKACKEIAGFFVFEKDGC
jgi:hypothetical protein